MRASAWLVAACTATALSSAPVRAQDVEPGFSVSHLVLAGADSEWFTGESLNREGHGDLSTNLVFDWAGSPLVVYDADGAEIAEVVSRQVILHGGVAYQLWDRLRLHVDIPVVVGQAGRDVQIGNTQLIAHGGAAMGDLQVGVSDRIYGEVNGVFRLGVGFRFFAPTGKQSAYAGDGKPHLLPRLNVAGDAGLFSYAANLGVHARLVDDPVSANSVGSEMALGASVGVNLLERHLLVGAEAMTNIRFKAANNDLFEPNRAAGEIIFGAHYTSDTRIRSGVGIAPGLSEATGSPRFRVLASLAYVPKHTPKPAPEPEQAPAPEPAPPPAAQPQPEAVASAAADRDEDGIADTADECPEKPGPPSTQSGWHGCPPARMGEENVELLQHIEFEFGTAKLRSDAYPILRAVRDLLRNHPELQKVEVEGHTDELGPRELNMRLSEQRARGVMHWLILHGIDERRLSFKGHGPDQPLSADDSADGRAHERRVDFKTLERAPLAPETAAPAAEEGAADAAPPPAAPTAAPTSTEASTSTPP